MTGNELLNMSLDLLGLRDSDGNLTSDVDDLKQRSVSLINIVIAENAEIDNRIRKGEHSVRSIETLDDIIDCTEIIARSVLPYGLARLLSVGEDDALSNSLAKLYEDARRNAVRFGKARVKPIAEVYR